MMCHRLDYPSQDDETRIVEQGLSLGLTRRDGGAVPQSAFDIISGEGADQHRRFGRGDGNGAEGVRQPGVHQSLRGVGAAHAQFAAPRFGMQPAGGNLAGDGRARARAFIHGRDHVVPDDLFALAEDVLLHRMRVTYEALAEGLTGRDVLQEIMLTLG